MTVTLGLTREPDKRIGAQAMTHRPSVEACLPAVIEPAAGLASAERASLEEVEAAMDALAEGLDDVLALAPEALTREAFHEHWG